MRVDDLAGALFDLADVDQHSGYRICVTAEDEVGYIVPAAAIAGGRFFAESAAIVFRRKLRKEQSARSGKLEAFTYRQQHDGALLAEEREELGTRARVCLKYAEQ